MKINIENLGSVKKAEIELSNFSVITGKNNTGKTYLSYALYGFLKTWSRNVKKLNIDDLVDKIINEGMIEIDLKKYEKSVINNFKNISTNYSKNINTIFSANESEFKNTVFNFKLLKTNIDYSQHFEIDVKSKSNTILKASRDADKSILLISLGRISKKDIPPKIILIDILNEIINKAILSEVLPEPFVITSERTGVQIFQRELDINKNVLFEKLLKSSKETKFDFNPFDFLKDVFDRYSKPIQDSIERVRDKEIIIKNNSFIQTDYPYVIKDFQKFMSGVGFKIIKNNGSNDYVVTYKEGRKTNYIPLYLGSSSTRALLDLYIYLKHVATKNDILIIDEPELNLHPELQIKLTRLLSSLSNIGIKILITTHSDYIVKEINNLLMLNNLKNDKEVFIKKYKYNKFEFLTNVNFYIAENNTLLKIDTDTFGLKRTNFDKTIDEINNIADELFDNLTEQVYDK